MSATTSLNPWKKVTRGEGTDWVTQILGPLAAGITAALLVNWRQGAEGPHAGWSELTPSAVAAAVALVVFLAMRPVRWSTYVGTRGVATAHQLLGCFRSGPRVFAFSSADDLSVSYARVHRRGYYVATAFRYDWVDRRKRRVFRIAGSFSEVDQNTPDVVVPPDLRRDHPIYFAQAAAGVWRNRSAG